MNRNSLSRTAIVFAALALSLAPAASAQTLQLGVDTTNFDRSVRPQDDFYRFVNGGWLQRTEIPADLTSFGAFAQLRENSRLAIRTILEEAVRANAPLHSEKRKIADLYASYMDSSRIEALGIGPLRRELNAIAAITTKTQLPGAFTHFTRLVTPAPYFGAPAFALPPVVLSVGPDPKQSATNIVSISQGGLGMPDRDYYSATTPQMQAARAGYVAYITSLLSLAKQTDAADAANRILELETAIAAKEWDRARNRDRNATYNKMTVAELGALSPSYDWRSHLLGAGVGKTASVIVRQPDYVTAFGDIVAATPVATWKEYLTFKLLDAYASNLPRAYQQARFEFRDKVLGGAAQIAPRWKRGVALVESSLGEAVGKLYVAKHFPPASKTRMDQLVRNLLSAYAVGIDSLEWMSPATKAAAKEKLSHITVKIGYPAKWRDFSALDIRRGDVIGDALRTSRYYYNEMIAQLGKPVDRTRWGMTPQTVNAQYSSTNNEILFPAGILQPPFFNAAADDAVNFGAIGAVIGHEISHGFDDQGRKSDGFGNLRDWWTAPDAAAFDSRAAALGAQYAAIKPVDDLHINPKLTMGENIGDLSGVAGAYRASMRRSGARRPAMPLCGSSFFPIRTRRAPPARSCPSSTTTFFKGHSTSPRVMRCTGHPMIE